MKAFTDISQSKTLSKILPLESADMRFCFSHTLGGRVTGHYPMIGREPSMGTVPCWSLAALLGVLPKRIELEGVAYELSIYLNGLYYWNVNNGNLLLEVKGKDNLVDACVAMIEKLNELKML